MSIATHNASFVSQKTRLTKFVEAIIDIVGTDSKPIEISALLIRSARTCKVTPAQMKYALSFADAEGLVEINYRDATVGKAHTSAQLVSV